MANINNININHQEDPYKIIDEVFGPKGWKRESKNKYYQGGKVLANTWAYPNKFGSGLYISIIQRPENLDIYEVHNAGRLLGKFNSVKEAAKAVLTEMHQIHTGRRLPPRLFTEEEVQHLNEFERKAKEKYRKDEFNPYNPSNVPKPSKINLQESPKINLQAAREIERGVNWSLSQKLEYYKQNLRHAFGLDNTNKNETNPNLIITDRGGSMDNNDLNNLLLNAKILLKALEDKKNHELIKSALEKVCPVPPQKLFRKKFLNQKTINKDEKNPDKEADARLGEEVEEAVERHFKENKEDEQKEGHKLMVKTTTNKNEKDIFAQLLNIADTLLKSKNKQKLEKKGKSGQTKHDRCVQHVKENSPHIKNPHAVCVSRGVYPEKWSKAEIKEALKEDYKPKFYKPKK
jgi:hypothetical protein